MTIVEDANTPVGPPDVVLIEDVEKSFTVRKDNSLKDRIVSLGRARRNKEHYVAVDGVTATIRAGSSVALMGPNGSGKSTLLKLIGGILSPSAGTIRTRGRVAALLELGAGFHPDLSGRENVFLNAALMGMSRDETEARFDEIVDFADIGEFIDSQVKFYSSGMFIRLAFAVAVHTDPDILIVDEVLAVGDEAFQRKCMSRIRQFQTEGRTIILVSHSAAQVTDICDRGIVLDHGHVVFDGTANAAVSALRDVLDGREIGSADLGTRNLDKAIEVRRVDVLDESGAPVGHIQPGETFIIRVSVRADRPFSTWAAGFSIDTPLGQMVLATNSARIGATLGPLEEGAGRVDFVVDGVHLAQGDYFVNANASEIIDIDSHVKWQAARFSVGGVEENFGVVAARVSVAERESL
jgi:ABC-type polysaccharide/polyol phosphate transport system ATPase subunit